ncbi:molybdopterin-dependent oxidoreductase [Aquibacillus koreensis]|uniref:Molybdopterin-dependent oxidoreductase n=1 Tax=Aquibacillus koreensis TaxID=279446 RepID=A0A9X3WMZ2_9BACI|nr:molybdopterin-dependent oxidoreductase [Aquibacillus koreensis]MCT2537877.1 molybdopterin-dependent oxidoreductase [Aquibacillus koreensis]MDC3422645.1 molybdopterin-dependent oxidoreductase [Aquibacillus koreensis]
MKWQSFFSHNLKFGQKLTRLHHTNALLFYVLSVTGILLLSSYFRLHFPSTRVWMKDIHIWIGFLSILPVLFYLPKIQRHVFTIRKRKAHKLNLFLVLVILASLIISGIFLTFQRHMPPLISSYALFIHDAATWIGLPYVIFHSITRSRWFRGLRNGNEKVNKLADQEPMIIQKRNPLLHRRTFLKLIAGIATIAMLYAIFGSWIKDMFNLNKLDLQTGNDMKPYPTPQSTLTAVDGRSGEFRYYTITEMPTFTNENWSLTIDGLVDNKLFYNWKDFIQLDRSAQVSNFHCVTGWSVYNVVWEGIPLKEFLDKAGVHANAKYVKLHSGDGVYTDSLTMSEAMMDDMMVAVLLDGELITQENGGPVRLVTPRLYGYKSVKWLTRIELIEDEHIGYWEERGYPQNAWVKGKI